MPFEWRVFELAKEPENLEQNQDAWWLNAEDGIAAIADGVTSGIFSRQWARILTRAAVDGWPDPSDEERFPAWLAELRAKWETEIDTAGLAWYQRAKLREGGFSTLVWLRLLENDALRDGQEASPAEVMAIGDSCVFHVRNDELLESFPLDAASEFDSSPLVLGSVDLNRDDQLQFERMEISCCAGDMLVLCTDAVAAWALQRQEQGEPVAWSTYWDMSPEVWATEVCELRMQSKMRYDDATLLLLRVGQVAGGLAEDYSIPDIELPQSVRPDEDREVDLLAVDWEEPVGSTDTPTLGSEDVPTEWINQGNSAYDGQDSSVDSDTYDLQTPPDPGTAEESESPPPLPPGAVPNSNPPESPPSPKTQASSDEDWRDQVNTISERWFKKISDGLSRGVDKLQEAKDSAVKKLRDKTDGTSRNDPDKPDS